MALGEVRVCVFLALALTQLSLSVIPEESSIPAPEECRDAGRVWGAFQLCDTSVRVMEPQFNFCPYP